MRLWKEHAPRGDDVSSLLEVLSLPQQVYNLIQLLAKNRSSIMFGSTLLLLMWLWSLKRIPNQRPLSLIISKKIFGVIYDGRITSYQIYLDLVMQLITRTWKKYSKVYQMAMYVGYFRFEWLDLLYLTIKAFSWGASGFIRWWYHYWSLKSPAKRDVCGLRGGHSVKNSIEELSVHEVLDYLYHRADIRTVAELFGHRRQLIFFVSWENWEKSSHHRACLQEKVY